jgi:hypothetical protein
MKITLLLIALAIFPSACASTPPLRPAVETHLQAVRTRNLDALLRYRATAPTGAVQDDVSWLALTFALEDGGWRLVFDQSTLIQPSP